MEWALHRTICRGFLTPSSRRGIRSARESDCSSQSNLSKGTGGRSASRAVTNRRGTARPSASSYHFIQSTRDGYQDGDSYFREAKTRNLLKASALQNPSALDRVFHFGHQRANRICNRPFRDCPK